MKILLVEDDPILRECLKIQLETLGNEVWEASCLVEVSQLLDPQGNTRNGFPVEAAVIDGNFPLARSEDEAHGFGVHLVGSLLDQGIRAVLYTGDEDLLFAAKRDHLPAMRKPGKVAEILALLGQGGREVEGRAR